MGTRLRVRCKHCGKLTMVGGRTAHLREKSILGNYREYFDFYDVKHYFRRGDLMVWVYDSVEKEGGLHIKIRDIEKRVWSEMVLSVPLATGLRKAITTIINEKPGIH